MISGSLVWSAQRVVSSSCTSSEVPDALCTMLFRVSLQPIRPTASTSAISSATILFFIFIRFLTKQCASLCFSSLRPVLVQSRYRYSIPHFPALYKTFVLCRTARKAPPGLFFLCGLPPDFTFLCQ